MAKITETTLRIRAQNLASKDLREVSTALDQLTDTQKENSSAAGLAGRAFRDLKAELAALKIITKNLAKRGGIAEALKKDKIAIGETEKKIRDLKAALGQLNATKAGGEKVKGLGAEIRKVERSIGATERKLTKQAAKFEQSAKAAAGLGISAKKTGQSIQKINAEAARTAELVRESERAMGGYSAAVRKSRDALRAEKAIHRDINRQIERRRELEKQGNQIAAQRSRQQAADRLVQRRTNEAIFAQFSAPPRLARGQTFGPAGNPAAVAAAKQASKEAAAATVRETALHERLNRVLLRRGGPLAKLATAQRTVTAAVNKSSSALDRNAKSLDRNHKLTGIFADTGRKSLSVYQRIRGQILATAAAYIGLFQAVNLVKSAITKEQEFRRIDIQLQVANKGDVEAAARDRKFLEEEADRMGLVYVDMAKNFANFKVSAASVGASNATIKKSFTDATTVVTGLALSAEDADGVFRAFVQILGKARVQAEELRGQLGDRLPGAVAAFAKSINLPLSQLDEYLKKGKGSVENFLKFLGDFADTTRDAAEKQSKTLFAQVNRLTNAYNKFLVSFASKGVSSGLEKVIDQLISKLEGGQGDKFASDLAKAFEGVAHILSLVIENFDTFTKLVKYYLQFQFAKAIVGIGYTFFVFGSKVLVTAKAIKSFVFATYLARAGVGTLTLGMRGLLLLLGPLGIAIGVAAGAWYGYARAQAAATKETEDHIGAVNRLKTAQGEALNAEIQLQAQGAKSTLREVKALRERLAAAKSGLGNNPIHQAVQEAADKLQDPSEVKSISGLETRIAKLTFKLQDLSFETRSASSRYIKSLEEERAARKADAAQGDRFEPPKGDEDKEKKAKDTSKAEAALAERRLDLADRTARELLDIENELLDARLSAEIVTQEQIDANLKTKLEVIGNDIAKKRIELEALKHDAERIGATDAAKSADAALARLSGLQAEKESKAQIEAITASIELKEKNINALIAARDGEVERLNALVEAGLLTEVEARSKIVALQLSSKDAIIGLITELQASLQALKDSDPNLAKILGVDELTAKMDLLIIKTKETQTNFQVIGKKLGGEFAAGASTAFGTLIKGLAGGIEGVNGIGDAFKNAGNAFREWLADFLVGIGQAILQALILRAITNALGITSGYGGVIAGALGGSTGHTGGVVKTSGRIGNNPIRQVSPAVFANAQRFHEGGLPGLRRNEVPAILKKNEEVLTQGDPRNVLNGGGQQPNMDVSIVNTIDSASVFEAGANTRRGRKVIFNAIQADREQFRRLLA